MKIKSIMIQLLICLLMLSSASAESTKASVAKIDYNEIDDLLVQVVLNMTVKQELLKALPSN